VNLGIFFQGVKVIGDVEDPVKTASPAPAALAQVSEVLVDMPAPEHKFMASGYPQDGDLSSVLSEGSTYMAVEMDCSEEQLGIGCGLKRMNAMSSNAGVVPAHVESAIQDLYKAIDQVQSMADSLRAAVAPFLVSATIYCIQFCLL
jgi:hypothetical protein